MAQINAAGTLAEALRASEPRPHDPANPLIDRLATALAIPSPDASSFDDGDDDLDLPMLVQGERFGAIVPSAAPNRVREGRAAMLGFGLGLALLIPLGVGMSNLLQERANSQGRDAGTALVTSLVPTIAATEDIGIITTRHATQFVPAATAPVLVEMPRLTAPAIEVKPAETPRIDRLGEAKALVAKGDIESARAVLKPLIADDNPVALLLLAETFDPNMLAAWSARGMTADANLARALYVRALAQGQTQARQRLEALE